MALRGGATIDVTLKPVSQMSPVTSALQGELGMATNAIVTRFRKGDVEAIKISKRGGFSPITAEVRDPVTGTLLDAGTTSPSLMRFPKFMASLSDGQLVVESGATPYVLSEQEQAWQKFSYTMPTNTIRQKIVYIDNHEMTIPDGAQSVGLHCHTWSRMESGVPGKCYVAFFDPDGTPVRLPFEIGNPGHKIKAVGSPNTGEFFVFTDDGTTCKVHVFDRHGNLVIESTNQLATTRPWDIVCSDTQGVNWVTSDGTNAKVVSIATGAGPSISMTPRTFPTTLASEAAVFLTNEISGDGFLYIATVTDAQLDFEGGPHIGIQYVYAYKIPPTGTAVAQHWDRVARFDTSRPYIPGTPINVVSNIAGYVSKDGGVLDIYSSGVQINNPLRNSTQCTHCNSDGTTASRNDLNGVAVASRAFTIGSVGVGYVPAVVMYYASVSTVTVNSHSTVGQPTYFLVEMSSGRDQVVGRFDYGGAAMDYTPFGADFPQASNGFKAVGMYLFHLPSPFVDHVGDTHLPLGFIGESVSTLTSVAGGHGDQIIKTRNTVGLKDTIVSSSQHGKAVDFAGEMLLPGPIATLFTGYGFSESFVNLAPEQPTVVIAAGGGLQVGVYSYQFLWECTTPSGKRAKSQPSAALEVKITSANQKATFTGTSLGMTTRSDIVLGGYRSAIIDGVMSVAHFKVTNDLDPIYNDPTSSTWSFVDVALDTAAAIGEPLYSDQDATGRAELFHDPAPPFSAGCVAGDRVLLLAYDNAVWFSAPRTEGQSIWFNADAWRIPLPTSDPGVAIAVMDNRAIIQCQNSLWFIPLGQFPDATGQGGSVPAPQRFPFSNGSTGFTLATREGLMYSSSSGQLWTIVRDLNNSHTGAPVIDELAGKTVQGMAVDLDQRIHIPLSSGGDNIVLVYDVLAQCWTRYDLPTLPIVCLTFRGAFTYVDVNGFTWQPNGTKADGVLSGGAIVPRAIITDVKILPIHIGGVKNWKRTWECQMFGTWKGDHDMHVRVTFDDNPVSTIVPYDFTPDGTIPYLYDLPPVIEEASSMAFEFFDSFPRGIPGDSFELEMLSFYVAMEKGLNKWPAAIRIPSGVVTYLVIGGGGGSNVNMVTILSPGTPATLATTLIPGFVSGKSIAFVQDNGHFYTLCDTAGTPDGINIVASIDGRFWVIV